jgi:hypothetical protein
MARLHASIADAGIIFDVGTSMDDSEVFYRRRPKSSATLKTSVSSQQSTTFTLNSNKHKTSVTICIGIAGRSDTWA